MTSLDPAPDSGGHELVSASYFTASAANGGHWEYGPHIFCGGTYSGMTYRGFCALIESLVESVFGAVKVKFGGTLRSRRDNRKAVEAPLRVVIYNAESANYLSWFNP